MKLDYQKAIDAGYSDQEIRDFSKTKSVELLNTPKQEGVGTFLKSAFEATGIPKFAKTTGAAVDTVGSIATMGINPELSSKLAERALKARTETGTTGSIDQGFGAAAKTAWNVGEAATRTGLTATGLTAAPATLLKTAAVSTPVSAVVSKLMGGTYSEGAGAGFGASAAEVGAAKIIKTLVTSPAAKKIISGAEKKGKTVLDKLNFGKVWGEEAKAIAKESGKKVSPKEVMSKAFVKLDEQGLSGSTKEKAISELQKIAKDAPNNIFDTLTQRRGSDKMIVRNLFGIPKSGTGKNVAVAAYRSALNDIIKGIPELANLDRKMGFFYKVKDPVAAIISNRLVQAGGAGLVINKILGK